MTVVWSTGIALIVAGCTVFLAIPPAAAAARQLGFMDEPGGRKDHGIATPMLGGTVLVAGWALGSLVGGGGESALFLGVALAWGLGTLDDRIRGGLGPAWKALGQGGVALAWLLASGHDPGVVILGLVWIVFSMNGFNLLDNTDGLCTMAALPPVMGLACLAILDRILVHPSVPIALLGALLGFLPHNWPRARIFLGDGGSQGVGFLVGAVALTIFVGSGSTSGIVGILAAVSFFTLPLLDTAVVTVSRLIRGRPPWVGDRNHLSHRLHRAGLSEGWTLWILGGVSGMGTATGMTLIIIV